MNIKEHEFLDRIKAYIQDSNAEALDLIVSDFATFTFKEADPILEEYSDEFFLSLIDNMGSTVFLGLEGSYGLLMLFEYDWGILTPNQKIILFNYIERYFASFSDGTSPFVLSELLGEYFCDKKSYTLLTKLFNSESEVIRACACHGITHFLKYSNDTLPGDLHEKLLQLTNDKSEMVREEALQTLKQLS